MKIIVGVDIDNVLRNWSESFNRVYLKHYPQYKHLIKPPITWNFFNSYEFDNITKENFLKNNSEDIQLGAETFPEVKEKLDWLVEQSKIKNFTVRIITKQYSEQDAIFSFQWLKHNNLFHKNFINVSSFEEKWRYCNIMIDDSPEVLNSCSKNKTSIRVNFPFNEKCQVDFSISKFTDLDETLLQQALIVAQTKLLIY